MVSGKVGGGGGSDMTIFETTLKTGVNMFTRE